MTIDYKSVFKDRQIDPKHGQAGDQIDYKSVFKDRQICRLLL